MKSGIRFTCLQNGDSLLGQTWEYKTLTGVEAIEQKLQDMFFLANKIGFTSIIDTVQIGKMSDGTLYIPNSGINGDVWPFNKRIEIYRSCASLYKINTLFELEFPTSIIDDNVDEYINYAIKTIETYSWVKYWQIMIQPESIDKSGLQKCSAKNYVKLIKGIYTNIHNNHSDIKIGGPGILSAITEYISSAYQNSDNQLYHTGWLAEATGEFYGTNDQYLSIGKNGFLDYIDFFAFQGRQNYNEFNYSIYQSVITKLKQGINTQSQRNGLNLDVQYLSTYQGHYADKSNSTDLQLQAYRDLREFMNCYAVNIIPFKTQLVDEFYDESDKNSVQNLYGILYYYLGNIRKPAFNQYSFLINALLPFTKLPDNTISIKNKQPYETDTTINSVMLMNDAGTQLVTIIWPAAERDVSSSNPSYTKVTLKASMNRKYYLPDGTSGVILTPMDVTFKKYDFIVVIEKIEATIVSVSDVKEEVTKRLSLYQKYISELVTMVPDTYPKDVYDVNFYKLLRSVAVELGDMRYEKDVLEDNMYLSTAHGDAIYNNFGAVIGVKWQSRWTVEQYRSIVSGIMKSLLSGATKASMKDAIQLFTSFTINIYEMFTDYAHYGLSKESNYDNQYKFTVEIEKPIDDTTSSDNLYDDVKFVTDIVKPAHTIPIIMIVLVGEEDYKDWYKDKYGIDFSSSDVIEVEEKYFDNENLYGWKLNGYNFVFKTYNTNVSSQTNINSAFPIGPKYTLYDREIYDIVDNETELYDKVREEVLPIGELICSDNVTKKFEESFELELEAILSEAKFGIKPSSTEKTLKTNGGLLYSDKYNTVVNGNEGRTTNSYKTGFSYVLNDELNEIIEVFWNEIYAKPIENELLYISYENEEIMKNAKEENKNIVEIENEEFKFGLVPYYDDTMMTYCDIGNQKYKHNRETNKHKYGVRYRLIDICNYDQEYNNEETYKTSNINESISLKMYTVDANNNEIILKQDTI